MPYIKSEARHALADFGMPHDAGELNFVVSVIINQMIQEKGLSYAVVNEIVGALECCKLELYRRVAAPYEDVKIKTNGDVYDESLLSRPDVGLPSV
jgi:hypothetical protein